MTDCIIPALAGLLAGVLTAWGVGGGSLLILYMTAFGGLSQQAAQGANLLYFLPTSLSALYSHIKNRLVDKSAALPAILAGVCTALAVSRAAVALDSPVFKKIFGAFILLVGLLELFSKKRPDPRKEPESPREKGG